MALRDGGERHDDDRTRMSFDAQAASVAVESPAMAGLRIAIVQGGPSTEAEVSRSSAGSAEVALRAAGHDVHRLELDAALAANLLSLAPDVVFPVVHGQVGEDGCLQGLLEVLSLPYVGSNVIASALAMDKRIARTLFREAGLPVARGTSVRRGDDLASFVARARHEIGRRLVVKPATHGSGIGVARFRESASDGEIVAALTAIHEIDERAIVEHFAVGREVTCGVLATPTPVAFPPTEIEAPGSEFYTYQARYAPGRSVHHCPAPFPAEVNEAIQRVAIGAFEALGCRDLARADFVIGDEHDPHAITLLEINTLPGFTSTSLYPEAAAVIGLSFSALCDRLARFAHTRGATPRESARPLPT